MWYTYHMTPKQRYFQKVYDNAPLIDCACGCGQKIKSKDRYARDKKYISGHNGRKYKDPKQFKREWNHRNRPARYTYKVTRLHKLKVELIGRLGNCCSLCGIKYDGKNAPIFDFHHLSNKDFNVGSALNHKSKEVIYNEVDKCQLLCSNCHRIHHLGEY